MVQIIINIEKKHLLMFSVIIVLFAGVGYVVGFGTSNPSVFGHTASEIQGAIDEDEPELGILQGSFHVSGDDIMDYGGGYATFIVENTGSESATALVSIGDVIIKPEGSGSPPEIRENESKLTIGPWEFKNIGRSPGSGDEILCIKHIFEDREVAYLDSSGWRSGSCPS